ncbi:MAG: DEAD/DEAH box helicase, partial [Candidatus Sericytochromatia bacterium]
MQSTKLFTEFDLAPELLEGLAKMGYTHPTPVQEKAIPAVATGKDLMVQARTGTGKTLAFGLPTLQHINATSPDTQVLVICPTRELAVQVATELARVAEPLQIIVAAVFGGVKITEQIDEMQWAPVVVGTPGRLRDHIERGYLHLDTCKVVVLDEADEMLDMGFKDDLEYILGKVPKEQRQTLLFSATFPPAIEKIAQKYMREPEKIEVSSGYTAATGLSHKFARVPKDKKIQALSTLMRQENVTSALIFCDTKVETSWVFQRLKRDGFSIGIITGDIPQEKRLQTLQAFRDGELHLLVATDVAARGLDIPSVSHVYHFTVPRDTATYIHRSGRTARAGKQGVSFTLVTPEEERDFQRIMRDIKQGQAPQGGRPEGRREEGRREEGRRDGRREEGREPRREEGRREEVREPRREEGRREGRREEVREPRREEGRREEGRREGRREEPRREGRREEPRRDGRSEARSEGGRGRGGRGRFDRNRYDYEPLPQRPEPDAVSHVIDRIGGDAADQQLSLAEYLLGRADGVFLLAGLLAQQPDLVDDLENAVEALGSGEPAAAPAPAPAPAPRRAPAAAAEG